MIVVAGFSAGGLSAQSISAGAVVGTVKETTSQPMTSVRVALTDRTSGFTWGMTTENDGRFSLTFLPPGEYDLLAEELGYRPVEVRGVRVSAGDELGLEAAEPPVMERAVERFTTIGTDTATVSGDYVFSVDDGSGPVRVVFDKDASLTRTPYAPGVVMDATGLVVQDGSGSWRIKPRVNGDVVGK